MSVPVFDELLRLLQPDLNSTRQLPDSVGAEEKLAMTLHFLSQGGTMQNIA
ncbi:hypothetical protein ABEB36_013631 [Hypothenemus hampei]|uniref:Uncharacterized protein n=1 Tax=Hypothenemus hampei TaxID=57062 RepID=A0ABD1E5S3_HYPHA